MRQTTLAVFAIVAIAAMMGVATVAPTYAAPSEKANNDKDGTFFDDVRNTFSVIIGQPQGKLGICGFGDDVKIQWTKIKTTSGTLWDNGHFKINISSERTYYAPVTSGDIHDPDKVIGVETVNQNKQGDFSELEGPVVTLHENTKLKCFNGAKGTMSHGGSTDVYRDGRIVHNNSHHE